MLSAKQIETYISEVILPKLEEQEKTGQNAYFGMTPLELVRDVLEFVIDGNLEEDPLEL